MTESSSTCGRLTRRGFLKTAGAAAGVAGLAGVASMATADGWLAPASAEAGARGACGAHLPSEPLRGHVLAGVHGARRAHGEGPAQRRGQPRLPDHLPEGHLGGRAPSTGRAACRRRSSASASAEADSSSRSAGMRRSTRSPSSSRPRRTPTAATPSWCWPPPRPTSVSLPPCWARRPAVSTASMLAPATGSTRPWASARIRRCAPPRRATGSARSSCSPWGRLLRVEPAHVFTFFDAKEAGAHMVTVDPHYSTTASKSDEWIPIEPGTDAALFLGMTSHIIDNDLADEDFMAQHSTMPFLVDAETGLLIRDHEEIAPGR